ncbi:IS5/IS1182 family transposase (plasmid) [Streptomyces fungicidicus]|uniref:IS5/IS1182 family transposase n=3 Tax=Streptomyces TaxID=1883 RepID=A0A494V9X3_9ACTN|nr:IS5 family transposase [Streptomyces fungicidicus]AYL33979.1 IS5/IS1182 family transposase [Streptomyces fungicidicus]AYL40464.1 IS5/IS1182 family transposase [Streptomyces fungicidicus]
MGASPWIVSNALWERIEPLLPRKERRFRHPGRRPLPDRQVLCGILFVLHTGIQWEYLPRELGFGSGMTCWRRLRDWNEAGVWQQLHEVLLAELNAAARLDWSRAVVDSSHVRAIKRGGLTGPSPVDRGRSGSKHHLITDGHGTPLAVILTGGNRNDVTQLMPLIDAVPPIRGRIGHPRRKPDSLFADRGYDHDIYRDQVRQHRIVPVIARRGALHGTGLGTYRWVVERSFAWLHGFKRLRIRWERRADIHEAFLKLACCLITHRQINSLC